MNNLFIFIIYDFFGSFPALLGGAFLLQGRPSFRVGFGSAMLT